jgi:hypothetical protein
VSQPLPRFRRRELEAQDLAKVASIVAEAGPDPSLGRPVAGATAAGDGRRLRGIPAIGRGVSGAIPGSQPGSETGG